ncbi:hypothetical protein GGS23DRAFT_602911 [Durotheca rogersii]|uniref:uncharacterized protein n=1 Tax=Durotheca rogersii TaxID=419775 RepID=UPI00221F1E73|nr:uncharacterized protein GGS23DRAFT_602911 [Durotheca rogersii]KAI5866622.1 hypothetical protein GGS23DRAFT_602911 [Durotheca rogersii]
MSVRPSSSRGPSSKSSTGGSLRYGKRTSRDDSFINLRRAETSAGFKSYAPTRGQLPTPEASPPLSDSPRKPFVPVIRMPTPESFNEGPPQEIGMALGSPTVSSPPSGSLRDRDAAALRLQQTSSPNLAVSAAASDIGSLYSHDTKPASKKQPGRWRLFGMFGKRPSDNQNTSPSEQRDAPKPGPPPDIPSSSSAWQESRVERSNTVGTRGAPRHKPIVVRSQTLPYNAENPAQKSKTSLRDRTAQDASGGMPQVPNAGGPLLNVEIPSVTMERYSVMFGSVLQSRSGSQPQARSQSQSPSQPSLLARRQATVQKLKSIDDAISKEKSREYPRRASSPQPGAKSPPVTLFPPGPLAIPAHTPPSYNGSSLHRSNTSPALLRSPAWGTFDRSPASIQRQARDDDAREAGSYKEPPSTVHPRQKGRLTIATLARAREQHPLPATREKLPQPVAQRASFVLESPSEISSPEVEVFRSEEPLRLRPAYAEREPEWEMVAPPPQQQSSTPSDLKKRLPSSPAPAPSSPAPAPPPPPLLVAVGDDDDDDDDGIPENTSNMSPVELSIARQISVSRQQRKMLKPSLKKAAAASAARPRPAVPKYKPTPVIAVGKDERYAEIKSAMPVLVVPYREATTTAAAAAATATAAASTTAPAAIPSGSGNKLTPSPALKSRNGEPA